MLLTKLHIPQLGKNIVHRSKLFDKLNEGLNRKLILVSAPAGYGKTTLLCDWIHHNKITTVWYSVDKRDNDSKDFLSTVISGIQTIHPEVGKSLLELLKLTEEIDPEYILELLVNDILKIEKEFLLVIDDFHLIEAQEIFKMLSYLIANIPKHLHIVISTRSDPMLPLARLRSQNELVEIRTSDLNFSANDISNLFNKRLKLGLSKVDFQLLEKKTEGWIAGLQLIILSIKGRDNVSDYIKELAGNNRYIMDYLIEEVLNIQTEEIRDFLLNTSVLEKFSGPLCDFVLQRNNSQLILEFLDHNNMFIVPLDNERKWFRYHHLFADLLKQRLSISNEMTIKNIHSKASIWFEKNDLHTFAIEHALDEDNYERAIHLLDEISESLVEKAQFSTIYKFAKLIPEEIVFTKSRFSIIYAWTLIAYGYFDDAFKILKKLEVVIQNNVEKENRKFLLGRLYVAYNYLYAFTGKWEKAFMYSELALSNLSANDDSWNYWANITYGEACLLNLELSKSLEAYAKAEKICDTTNSFYLNLVVAAKIAIVLILQGRYKKSYNVCKKILNKFKSDKRIDEDSVDILSSMFYSMIGFILIEWNILDEGIQNTITGYELSEKVVNASIKGYTVLVSAEAYSKLGDVSMAAKLNDELGENLANRLVTWIFLRHNILKSKLLISRGDYDKAREVLTEYERKKDNLSVFESYTLRLSYARLFISQCKLVKAVAILEDLTLKLKKVGVIKLLIEGELLLAKAFSLLNQKSKAIVAIMNAVLLAQEERFIRTFLNEGEEIEHLILELLDEKSSKSLGLISLEYLNKLKTAFDTEKKQKKVQFEGHLSNRELDTLKLVAENLSNQEIADQLFISLNTVKSHVKKILLKLEVENRSKAVLKAKEQNIL